MREKLSKTNKGVGNRCLIAFSASVLLLAGCSDQAATSAAQKGGRATEGKQHASSDPTLRELPRGERTPELVLQLGHRALPTRLAVSPDGRQLATGSRGNTVIRWDLVTDRYVRTRPEQVYEVEMSQSEPSDLETRRWSRRRIFRGE